MEKEARELFEKLKETLATAGEMAKQGLDMAGKKTGEAFDAAKIRWKLAELHSETQRLYREAGRRVYEARDSFGIASGHLEKLFDELDRKYGEMETLKRELWKRRGERPCPNADCPAMVRDDDAFCRKCGAPLEKDAP